MQYAGMAHLPSRPVAPGGGEEHAMNVLEPVLPWTDTRGDGGERGAHEELLRTSRGEIALNEAFLAIGRYAEEQRLAAPDLLEREIWVMRALLEASDAIWGKLPSPTLSFTVEGHDDPGTQHLELGRFAHLAPLNTPSVGEQRLIAATGPCWARVSPDPERQLAGQTGALSYAYEPLSDQQAVSALGFERIMPRIEEATRVAAKSTLDEALSRRDRQARLMYAEQMLGWRQDPTAGIEALPVRTKLLLTVAGHGKRGRSAASLTFLGLLGVVLYFLLGTSHTRVALLLIGPCLFIWQYVQA